MPKKKVTKRVLSSKRQVASSKTNSAKSLSKKALRGKSQTKLKLSKKEESPAVVQHESIADEVRAEKQRQVNRHQASIKGARTKGPQALKVAAQKKIRSRPEHSSHR